MTKWLLIGSSFLMDIMSVAGLYLFNCKFDTLRVLVVFSLFYPLRALIQNNFLMNRLDGRIWFDPGVPSLTVPYHDTNDFFFSGHLGAITIWALEFYSQGSKCMGIYNVVLLIIMWIFLTFMRVHYFIDLITGVMVAHLCFIMGDWISYYLDLKVLGVSHKSRNLYVHDACKKCGWCNQKTDMLIDKNEKEFLQTTHSMREAHKKELSDSVLI